MEERVAFERFLYGDGKAIVISDMEFCVDRIVMLPKIRPHQLEKAVQISVEYCHSANFRRKILEKSYECPVLIYLLYKRGVLIFGEIEPFLKSRDCFLISYYFRKEIYDFESFIGSKQQPYSFDESFLENENDIDQMIEYGFLPSSIEYVLKYDVIDDLNHFNIQNQEAVWSPFEWSFKPKYLDILSFSGFFGSIKCFKYLLMNGMAINSSTISMVICSDCLDLFHLCQGNNFVSDDGIFYASKFCGLGLLVFMFENGSDNNGKDKDF